jgi:hypothetical protein
LRYAQIFVMEEYGFPDVTVYCTMCSIILQTCLFLNLFLRNPHLYL